MAYSVIIYHVSILNTNLQTKWLTLQCRIITVHLLQIKIFKQPTHYT
jgi:hypothetical protein